MPTAKTSIARSPLGGTTKAAKWQYDVDTKNGIGAASARTWLGIFGVTESTPKVDGNFEDDSDYDGAGWGSQQNTQNAFSISLKVKRAVKPGTVAPALPVYDPGQEYLRLRSVELGDGNIVYVRWYEMEENGPRVEAYEGFASVSWSEDGGNTKALSTATITLNGRGKRLVVPHPDIAIA